MLSRLKKYFIPQRENDHAPHILRGKAVVITIAAILIGEVIFLSGAKYVAPQSELFAVIFSNALVDGTNQNRLANNLPELRVNPLLEAAARAKALHMAQNGYFAHTSPTGVTPWYWFEMVGYDFSYAGENLAVNFLDSEDVTNAWMESPTHRANILRGNFTEIGIATAQGEYEGKPATFVVQLFGSPAKKKVAAAPNRQKVSSPILESSSTPLFVAVRGAEIAAESLNPKSIEPQNNPVQGALAAPRKLANGVYIFFIGLFALALLIMIWNMSLTRHPRLIFGGALVIVVAGAGILINQHVSLLSASIL
ncbi:MAG: hypothetical protein FJY98_02575 [Candidatus Liptonbacteria bacterium]|nr:hypothetical protein [Candidatus Liptonbacteria bacterium]